MFATGRPGSLPPSLPPIGMDAHPKELCVLRKCTPSCCSLCLLLAAFAACCLLLTADYLLLAT